MDEWTFNKIVYDDINPASRVDVCMNVPLDNSYKNTLTFKNEAEQLAYFRSKALKTYENLSPIRLGAPIRLPIVADALYGCNYLIIRNDNFTTKTLYAFISQIDYVNPKVCEVHFEIDVMQTWYFNMNIKPCYVEREHANTDAPGANTVDEGLSLGEYKRRSRIRSGATNKRCVLVTLDPNYGQETSNYNNNSIGGIFCPLKFQAFNETNVAGNYSPISDYLQTYANTGRENAIINIQMAPADFVTPPGTTKPKSRKFSTSKSPGTLDGYTPKNKKLLQYPYTYLELDNTQGQVGVFKFEFFSSTNCEFKIIGCTSGDSIELVCYPLNYDGMGENITEYMTLGGFPMCAWTGNAYQAYVALNNGKQAIQIGSDIMSIGMSAAMGNPIGAIAGGIGAVRDVSGMAQEHDNAKIAGNKIHGTTSSNTFYSMKLMDFWLTQKMIDRSHAEAIDAYFTRFGYATRKIKQPNITGRKSFNYVKTIGSCVIGTIPFNDLAKINAIFDRGITFWHGDYVGNYSRDNSIV